MGYMKHNAILVTTWSGEHIEAAAAQAKELGLQVLGPSAKVVNAFRSLLVCPDGSKEGWQGSDEGDARRAGFREWLRSQTYDDDSSPIEWVEFSYGNDDSEACIVGSTWFKTPNVPSTSR
jgi:hypothetical protein